MKTLVVVANIAAIVTMLFVMADDPPSLRDKEELALYALFTLTPIFTVAYLWAGAREVAGKSGWISLYFQRKAAEERKKLRELEAGK
jgi:cell division protein FtsW (lipid II flippase)